MSLPHDPKEVTALPTEEDKGKPLHLDAGKDDGIRKYDWPDTYKG